MPSPAFLPSARPPLRAALALTVAVQVACVPAIAERCRLVTNPGPPPALPSGFAELDALLLRRANEMTLAARELNSSLVIVFHRDFAEVLLPELCWRLEKARELALAGRMAEAGRKYQALLVATQVLAYAVAVQSMAQYADASLQPGFQLSQDMEKFASEAEPIFSAALSEDPRQIERALLAQPEVFAGWAGLLKEWPVQIKEGAHKVAVAKVIWDIAFLVVATYQAAGAAAEIAAAGRPPMPPFPILATGGGAAMARFGGAASLEMAEALRRLMGLGALDAGVVAALSMTLGGRGAVTVPASPTISPMSSVSAESSSAKLVDNALQPFKDGGLTQAGRALTKHPEVVGHTKDTLRQAFRTEEQVNTAAEAALREIVRGSRTAVTLPRYGVVLEFRGTNGFGARFYAETGEFIGFINP